MWKIVLAGSAGFTSAVIMSLAADPVRAEQPPGGIVTGLAGQAVTGIAADFRESQRPQGLNLGDAVPPGRTIRTGQDGRVEIVWDHRALVTVQERSRITLDESQTGRTEVHVKEGAVRVALAYRAGRPTDFVTIVTPTSRVITRGGIVEVGIPASSPSALSSPSTDTLLRRTSPRPVTSAPETVRIMEGQARIESLGSDARSQLLDARSQVQIVAGAVAGITELPPGLDKGTTLEASAISRAIPQPIKERMVALHVQHALDVEKSLQQSSAPATEKPDVTQQDLRGTVLPTSLGVPSIPAQQDTAGASQQNVAPRQQPVSPPPIAPIPTPPPQPNIETRATRTPPPAPIPDLPARTAPRPDVRATDRPREIDGDRFMRDIMRGDEGDRGRGDNRRRGRGGRDD